MSELVHSKERLKELQALPLSRKVMITQARIIEWHNHYNGDVVVSFSGGKDSTVLLHLVRQIYPDTKAVFSNTGLEYPELQTFVRSFDNVEIITPPMRFDQVLSKYGYPLISKDVSQSIYEARTVKRDNARVREKFYHDSDYVLKYGQRFCLEKWLPMATELPVGITHLCCKQMKKIPLKKYRNCFVATLAEESILRENAWIAHGCNAFDAKNPKSQPMSFWTEQDVLSYIVKNNIEIASVYGEIVSSGADGNEYPAIDVAGNVQCNLKCSKCSRTGCIFCGFGFHLDKGQTRFQRISRTHPRQYEYCIGGGQWVDNPLYDPTASDRVGRWKVWNPKKIWVPSKKGLGMGKVFDMVNELYGKDFYKYE